MRKFTSPSAPHRATILSGSEAETASKIGSILEPLKPEERAAALHRVKNDLDAVDREMKWARREAASFLNKMDQHDLLNLYSAAKLNAHAGTTKPRNEIIQELIDDPACIIDGMKRMHEANYAPKHPNTFAEVETGVQRMIKSAASGAINDYKDHLESRANAPFTSATSGASVLSSAGRHVTRASGSRTTSREAARVRRCASSCAGTTSGRSAASVA